MANNSMHESLLPKIVGRPVWRPFTSQKAYKGRKAARRASQENGSGEISMRDRLKAAEAEAEKLRKQLEAAKAAQGQKVEGQSSPQPEAIRKSSRIDGAGLQRETLFPSALGEWLSESDFSFFTGGAPGEESQESTAISKENEAVVRRRLIIGAVLTVAAGAFALLPTDSLRLSRPSKPLFFYLVPLVRVQELLRELEEAVSNGKITGLQQGLARIQGEPNNAVENIRNAAAVLPNSQSREKAGVLARDVIEYLDSVDYNKYYESLQQPGTRGGDKEKMFADFSLSSIRAASAKLKAFFSQMPQDQLEAARQYVAEERRTSDS